MIMHLDMNSYFATVEQQCDPFLRGKPICIAGKGSGERTVCAAASIEAKKFGVKSGTSAWEAKALCSQIILIPADFEKYQYISRKVFAIIEEYSPNIEIFSIDEAFADLSHIKTYTEAAILADEIKFRIKNEIGDYLKCSVGLAENKLLAKLASEMQKPDGLTIIKKADVKKVLDQTPVEDLCGIGRSLQFKLNQTGVKKVGELNRYSLESLIRIFGTHSGKTLKQMGQGIDPSPVLPYYLFPSEKSFGHSYTLPQDIRDKKEAKKVLLKLAEKVGRRMRKKKVFGKTVQLYIRFADFTDFSQQVTTFYLQDGFEIYQTAAKLFDQEFQKAIRLIGVTVTNLKYSKEVNQTLFTDEHKKEEIIKVTDKINDHFGEFTIYRSSLTKIKDRIQNIPDGRNKRIF